MLLTIDIGNTSITFGIFNKDKLLKVFRVATRLNKKDIKNRIKENLKNYREKIDSAIICSVVPDKTEALKNILKQLLKIKAKIAGEDIQVPIKNLYKKPKQVGADRLVNAFACKVLYGFPAVIIDFGTATTFDYINKKGEYEGGIITPGIEITLDALFKKTALLPRVKIKRPRSFLGKSTTDSIRSGVSYGLSYMCDGLIGDFKRRYSKNAKVIATGGYAAFFKKICKFIDIVDEDLILKGLRLLCNE